MKVPLPAASLSLQTILQVSGRCNQRRPGKPSYLLRLIFEQARIKAAEIQRVEAPSFVSESCVAVSRCQSLSLLGTHHGALSTRRGPVSSASGCYGSEHGTVILPRALMTWLPR